MKTVEVTEATGSLCGSARKEMREPLLVAKQGKAVAVVIPLTEYDDLESVSLSMNAQFMEIIERSRASARSGALARSRRCVAGMASNPRPAAPARAGR